MTIIQMKEVLRKNNDYSNRKLTVCGWVKSNRNSKSFGFIMLNDGTSFSSIQIVYDTKLNNFNKISKINVGLALIVTGILLLTPDAQLTL